MRENGGFTMYSREERKRLKKKSERMISKTKERREIH